MTARSIRRAVERKAAKQAHKQQLAGADPTLIPGTKAKDSAFPQPSVPKPERPGCSTGPRTAEGKGVSSLNHTKHGLTGNFRVLKFESQELFDELRNALRSEHAPATPTEFLMVDRMAEHVWLSQRAQHFQDSALSTVDTQWLTLMLRYQTTHDRAFHKCLAELRTLRREREARGQAPQFDSQEPPATPTASSSSKPAAATASAAMSSECKRHLAPHSTAGLPQPQPTPSSNRTHATGGE